MGGSRCREMGAGRCVGDYEYIKESAERICQNLLTDPICEGSYLRKTVAVRLKAGCCTWSASLQLSLGSPGKEGVGQGKLGGKTLTPTNRAKHSQISLILTSFLTNPISLKKR